MIEEKKHTSIPGLEKKLAQDENEARKSPA